MRKIVVLLSISLDGYFEGPNREIDWHLVDEEVHSEFNQVLGQMSAFLGGRVTYELMDEFWPTADQDPESPPPIVEFAKIWRDMPKFVFSKQPDYDAANATVMHHIDPEQINQLKAQPGGDMALGGPNLAAEFRRLGLIDEYRIYVHPVLIGRGKPLFEPEDSTTDLKLIESRSFGNGVVLLRYEVARPA